MNDAKLDFRDPEWVAETLGIERNTVYKFLRAGELPGLQRFLDVFSGTLRRGC